MHIGTPCPLCKGELWLMSTTNEWVYFCKPCDARFNRQLEPMR